MGEWVSEWVRSWLNGRVNKRINERGGNEWMSPWERREGEGWWCMKGHWVNNSPEHLVKVWALISQVLTHLDDTEGLSWDTVLRSEGKCVGNTHCILLLYSLFLLIVTSDSPWKKCPRDVVGLYSQLVRKWEYSHTQQVRSDDFLLKKNQRFVRLGCHWRWYVLFQSALVVTPRTGKVNGPLISLLSFVSTVLLSWVNTLCLRWW